MTRARLLPRTIALLGACAAFACTSILGIGDRTLDPQLDASGDGPGIDVMPDIGGDDGGPMNEGGDVMQPDTGPCGDTSSDMHNCGRCGHDCLGGACMGGICQPTAILDPSMGYRPWHLSQDANALYWTDYINSTVGKTDKSSGMTIILYAGGFAEQGIAADDAGAVFFCDVSNVYRCAVGGCAGNPLALIPGDAGTGTPWYVAVDDNGVYWTESDTQAVRSVPKMGGAVKTLYAPNNDAGPEDLRSDGQFLYLANDDGTVLQIPNGGGAPKLLNTALQLPNAFQIAVDSQNVYWSQDDPNNGPGSINLVGKNAQSPHAFATNQAQPGGVAVDSQAIYWTTIGTNLNLIDGAVWTCPLSACNNPTQLAKGQHIPRQIVVDDKAVYWTNYGNDIGPDGGNGNDGAVMKVAKP